MVTTLKLEIVTPDATAYSEDVEMVTLPGVEGQMGVYPQHVPLLTQMVPGEIIVRKAGHDSSFAVGEGLVEITGDHVSILTDMAIAADKIDEAKVEEARQRAQARLHAFEQALSRCTNGQTITFDCPAGTVIPLTASRFNSRVLNCSNVTIDGQNRVTFDMNPKWWDVSPSFCSSGNCDPDGDDMPNACPDVNDSGSNMWFVRLNGA